MSESYLEKEQVLDHLIQVIEIQEEISIIVEEKLCDTCERIDPDWLETRKLVVKHLKNLISSFKFSLNLPSNDLGIAALAAISALMQIRYGFSQVLVMLDMIRGETFAEVYLDSLTAIASKVRNQFSILKNLGKNSMKNPEAAKEDLEAIFRLEREIDEDNIVICRQITIATEGDSPFICYIMRKVVRELEHISDKLKECAEIIIDI